MAKFMLARGKKPNAYAGLKRVERPGNLSDIMQKVEIPFYPGRAVDVPDDVDVSAWVENGHLIPIRDGRPQPPERVEEPAPKPESTTSVATKPVTEQEPEEVAPVTPPPEPEPEEEEEGDYTELKDGTLQCAYCDKTYKPSSRAVAFMEAHIEKDHT